jgi:hypothetical protein
MAPYDDLARPPVFLPCACLAYPSRQLFPISISGILMAYFDNLVRENYDLF